MAIPGTFYSQIFPFQSGGEPPAPVVVKQREQRIVTLQIRDMDGTPIDLTGVVATFGVKISARLLEYVILIEDADFDKDDVEHGNLSFLLTTDMLDISARSYFAELKFELDPIVAKSIDMEFIVQESIT